MICKECNEEFDEKESKRMFGALPADNGFCCPTCFTMSMMESEKND